MNQIRESFLPSLASLLYLTKLGFNFKKDCELVKIIRSIRPSGGTKMRDAIKISTSMLLDLGGTLKSLGSDRKWNIVHIVLTDGDDTGSQKSLNEVINLMYAIGKTLKVQTLKTWFIGVDLQENSDTFLELEALAFSGGENAEFEKVNNMEIDSIFEKIKISLGAIKKTHVNVVATDNYAAMALQEKIDPVLLIEKQQFVVLFTLDISGSMSGMKWVQVCESVEKIINYLEEDDLIGCVVFNDKIDVLLSEKEKVGRHFDYSINANEPYPNPANVQNNIIRHAKRFPRGCYDWPWYYFLPIVIILAVLFFLVIYLIFAL